MFKGQFASLKEARYIAAITLENAKRYLIILLKMGYKCYMLCWFHSKENGGDAYKKFNIS